MELPTRHLLLGLALGALAATGLAATGGGLISPAWADGMPSVISVGGINPAKLLHFPDHDVPVSDGVSTSATNTSRIKKVEYGRVSYVDIVTTATGTYSSDGLSSPNVNYPGVDKPNSPHFGSVTIWSGTNGWQSLGLAGGSFLYERAGSNRIFVQNGQACVITRHVSTC